jgi:D-sedoheptulose 7-phosphate isomerase
MRSIWPPNSSVALVQNVLPYPRFPFQRTRRILTAIGNDYGYDRVFARQIEALGQAGDAAIGISTSGNSPSVLEAIDVARAKGLFTVGFTGETGGKMTERTEVLFQVPSRQTPRIQETHILLGHIICELVDRELFPDAYPSD